MVERIGSFAMEFSWNDCFTVAQVVSGRATLLRSLRAVNSRGSVRDWVKIVGRVGAVTLKPMRVDHVEPLGVREPSVDRLALPAGLGPGYYDCTVTFVASGGDTKTFSHSFEILPHGTICTDFTQADLLAAHVTQQNEALSAFADDATRGVPYTDRVATVRALYEAVRALRLDYRPVPTVVRCDHQIVFDAPYTLAHGGSCADLSLMFASLMLAKGLLPVIVMTNAHMLVGCRMEEMSSVESMFSNQALLLRQMQSEQLLMFETTCACAELGGGCRGDFDLAVEEAAARLSQADLPLVAVDVCAALRSDRVRAVPTGGAVQIPAEADERVFRCIVCGYDEFSSEALNESTILCPACGKLLAVPTEFRGAAQSTPDPEDIPLKIAASTPQYRVQNGEALVIGIAQNVDAVRVETTYQGVPVVKIADGAFSDCRIRQAQIPDGVRKIGNYAFRRCDRLENVFLPSTLAELGMGAFHGCSRLGSVRIPGALKRIPRQTFNRCTALTTLVIEEGVQIIDEYAFSGCTSLETVVLPASMVQVRANAFEGCAKLREVRVGSSATRIDPHAFAHCKILSSNA